MRGLKPLTLKDRQWISKVFGLKVEHKNKHDRERVLSATIEGHSTKVTLFWDVVVSNSF